MRVREEFSLPNPLFLRNLKFGEDDGKERLSSWRKRGNNERPRILPNETGCYGQTTRTQKRQLLVSLKKPKPKGKKVRNLCNKHLNDSFILLLRVEY